MTCWTMILRLLRFLLAHKFVELLVRKDHRTTMQLDENQLRAVTSSSSRILACSVPGSGKTTVLTARIGHLVHAMKHLPSRVCAITFTRLGAAEIKKRLPAGCERVYVGTLHAMCLRIVREFGASAGYDASWLTLVDDDEAELDLREVLCDLAICRRRGDKMMWVAVTSSEWDSFYGDVTSGRITEAPSDPVGVVLWQAYQCFLDRLRSQNVLTFNTLLGEALRILDTNPAALAHWQQQIQHVLVDEAQDTSNVQWSIVWRLVERAEPETLFVVGDDDQAIFGWRGAEPREMIDLSKRDGVEVVKLVNTYRFGDGIGDPASALIRHNTVRIEKDMQCFGSCRGVVKYVGGETLAGVAGLVSRLQSDGGTVAVLGRTHDLLRRLSGELTAQGVKHLKIGRTTDLRKSASFRACLGYFRLACNRFDRRAFAAVCATEGIGSEQMLAIREAAATGDGVVAVSFVDALGRELPRDFDDVLRKVRSVALPADFEPVAQWFSDAESSGGLDLSDVKGIVDYVSLSDVQYDLLLDPSARLILATYHATKGLEFDHVVLLGMNSGAFPTDTNLLDGRLEEERRLCYVGLTRAKKSAHMVVLQQQEFGPRGRLVRSEASCFVGEAIGFVSCVAADQEDLL